MSRSAVLRTISLVLPLLSLTACLPFPTDRPPVVPTLDLTAAHQQEVNAPPPLDSKPACRSTGTLDVGMDASYPPMEYIDDATGQIKGFDVDFLNAIFKGTDLKVLYHNAKFDTIFNGLRSGRYSLVHDTLTITPNRSQTMAFANPYFVGGQVLIIRQSDLDVITKADNKLLGAEDGTSSLDVARGISTDVKTFDAIQSGLDALSKKSIDGMVVDQIAAAALVHQNTNLNLVVMPSARLSTEYYAIAMPLNCPVLQTLINRRQAALMADGTYQTLYRAYFGEDAPAMFKPGGSPITFQEALAAFVLPHKAQP